MNHLAYFCERFKDTTEIVPGASKHLPANTVNALDFFQALEDEAYNSIGGIEYTTGGRVGVCRGKDAGLYYLSERAQGRPFTKEEAAMCTKMILQSVKDTCRLLFDQHYTAIPEWVKRTRMFRRYAASLPITG